MSTRRPPAPLSLVPAAHGPGVSDAVLAQALAEGDAWAVSETWRRFAPMVLKMAERALGSPSEADDVCQDVFCYLFRKAKTLRDPDSLRSFVYSFAVRELKYQLRRRKVRGWLTFHQPEVLAELRSHSVNVESRDLLRRCHALLDRLSPRDRLVFVLRRMESMTVEEIATTMQLSVSTVKRSMAHASGRLSRWMQADPDLAGLVRGEQPK